MSELLKNPETSFQQNAVRTYLESLHTNEWLNAAAIAQNLRSEKSLESTIILVPVAAHQEASQIYPAIKQYARQNPQRPFSIILGLNCPADQKDNPQVELSAAIVSAMQIGHPELDIRMTFATYDQPRIGAIRRDIWNGTLALAEQEGLFTREEPVLGLNQDIDIVEMPRSYVANIQKAYDTHIEKSRQLPASLRQDLPIAGTRMKHKPSPQHPNISQVVAINEFLTDLACSPYEAGMVIPLATYAQYGGFDRQAKTGEIVSFYTNSEVGKIRIAGLAAFTSIRRYLERLSSMGLDVWGGDTFSANDACREKNNFPDITFLERADYLVKLQHKIDISLENALAVAVRDYDTQQLRDGNSKLYDTPELREYVQKRAEQLGRPLLRLVNRYPQDAHFRIMFDVNFKDEILQGTTDKVLRNMRIKPAPISSNSPASA